MLRCGFHQGCRGISGTHFYYSRDDIIQHVCVVYFAYVSDAIRRVENSTKFALFLFYLSSFYFNPPASILSISLGTKCVQKCTR